MRFVGLAGFSGRVRRARPSLLAVVAAIVASPGLAQDQDLADCRASDPERSIAGCTRIIERGSREPVPGRARAFFNRGVARQDKGEDGRAALDYTEALRLNPRYVEALNNRSIVRYNSGDYAAAVADAAQAIKLNPRYAAAYSNRGNARRRAGDLGGAFADYAEAIKLDPADSDARASRGSLLNDSGQFERALADLDAAIKMRPNHARTYMFRAAVHENRQQTNFALADYTRAVELDPKLARARSDRAQLLSKMGDPARAAADFEAALALDPSSAVARTGLEKARRELAAAGGSRPAAEPSRPAVSAALSEPKPVAPVSLSERELAAAAAGAASARAETRVALVIGNAAYGSVPALPNAGRDADGIAAALKAAGFDRVTLVKDAGRAELLAALTAFAAEAERADWAVVYFAGHGMEVSGVNYLVPVDARLRTDVEVGDEAVSLERVIGALEPAKKLRLVVLDACRDNPFAQRIRRTAATRSIGRGLASIEPDGATLVAFAAKHGNVAQDGDGQNSPFARALIGRLATPGLEINKLFRLVRDDVMATTRRQQEPFVYGSLPGEDFFPFRAAARPADLAPGPGTAGGMPKP